MRAVITAGGTVDDAFAALSGVRIKALASIRGRTILDRTIDALHGCGVSEVAIVGASEVHLSVAGRARAIDAHERGSENVLRALRTWEDDAPLLYLTSDMPYITADALRDFIERTPADSLAMPLTEYDAFVRRFPDAPPFGITLGGERVVNGGAFIIPAGARERLEKVATAMFDARKAPWRMAQLAGPLFLLRFALKRLSVSELERHARRVLGIAAVAVRGAAPELAYDADTAEEYRYASERA